MSGLWKAAKIGCLQDVKRLVKNGADVNRKDKENRTVLCYAVDSGSQEVVKFLIENRADVNQKGECGATVLFTAIKSGSLDLAKHLVENGANVNAEAVNGVTALSLAVRSGKIELVKFLLHSRACVNVFKIRGADCLRIMKRGKGGDICIPEWLDFCECQCILHVAIQYGSLDMVEILVEHGAHLDFKNSLDESLFHFAVSRGSLEIVKYLFNHNSVDVNCENRMKETSLHYAAKRGSLEIVKYLVQQGSELSTYNIDRETALHFAVRSCSVETVKYLIQNGAEVTSEDGYGENTVLYLACLSGNAIIVQYLLQHGAIGDMHKCDSEGQSPLYIAYIEGNIDVVRTLLNMGYDLRRQKFDGGSDEINNILELESKKSIKHKKKIQSLRELDDEKLTKMVMNVPKKWLMNVIFTQTAPTLQVHTTVSATLVGQEMENIVQVQFLRHPPVKYVSYPEDKLDGDQDYLNRCPVDKIEV